MTDWTCRQVILDLLIEYEDGTMPAAERADFERHVEMCPPCVRFLTTYRATGTAPTCAPTCAVARTC